MRYQIAHNTKVAEVEFSKTIEREIEVLCWSTANFLKYDSALSINTSRESNNAAIGTLG